MNISFNTHLIESCPDFIARMRMDELEGNMIHMTPFQKSAAISVLSIIPKSQQEERELIAVLDAITTSMKKARMWSVSFPEDTGPIRRLEMFLLGEEPQKIKEQTIKSMCLKEACRVFEAQTCYEEHAAPTPLSLAKEFYKWITSPDEDKQRE